MLEWQLQKFEELSLERLYAIMRIRQEVFIVEQNSPYLDADGKDFKSLHLMGLIGDDLIAYSRIVPPGLIYKEASIGRIVTNFNYRKKAYGKELMQKSLDETFKIYGPCDISITAQVYLKKFYEGYGFEQKSEPFIEDGIPHIVMLRKGGG